MKVLLAHCEGGIRRNHIDMIALDGHSLFGLRHRHGRLFCEELRQQALVARIEMLDEDKRHPTLGGERSQQLRDRLQAPCGSTDSDDGKSHVTSAWLTAPWRVSF
jgi:hypothetical protein